mgnify:CR=1 FL=1
MSEAILLVAQGYEMVAAGLRQMAEAGTEMPVLPVLTEKTDKTPATKKEEKTITQDDLRLVLAEKSRAGKTQEVKMLLRECGADKLSAVPEEKYPELLKKAEAL